jgi:isopentenyldiphosphate isomerase
MRYGRQDYMVCKLFRCRYDGPLKPNEEVADMKWFKRKELKELLVKTRKLTPWAAEHLKWQFGRPHKLVIL